MSVGLIVGVTAWLRQIGSTPLARCKIHVIATGNCSEISLIRANYRDSNNQEFVLRRIISEPWLRREGNLVHREATALSLAYTVAVRTPNLIASDANGHWTGRPALLMSRIQGIPWDDRRIMTRDALAHLARALRAFHEFDYGLELNQLPRYKPHHWRTSRIENAPTWAQSRQAWKCALAMTNAWEHVTSVAGRECLLHRDYRPGNALWCGEALTGVVDWVTACRGNPAADVGHCRWNLCRAYGPEVARAFSSLYGCLDYDPIWDIVAAVGGYPDTPPRDAAEAARIDHFVTKAVRARSA
jgi:aminoglycoside phosphotransferase (APT) family kinase protein